MAAYYGKAEVVTKKIVAAFQSGDVPKALAPIFLKAADGIPCRAWSWSNQFVTLLQGHDDARGFRQWEKVGRHVRKGEKGFPILVPMTKKMIVTDDNGEQREKFVTYGFKHAIVFGYEQTEGKDLPKTKADTVIEELPLIAVAKSWGLKVKAISDSGKKGYKGYYQHGVAIAMGVENLATWAHELLHAADDKLGNLKERGQHWRSEIVAELGGAVLLRCIGYDLDADLGGAWEYIQHCAKETKTDPAKICMAVLKRTCEAVELILKTAEGLGVVEADSIAA